MRAHRFIIIEGLSYNWIRKAALENAENLKIVR